MATKYEEIERAVKILANMPEEQRKAILGMNFTELKGIEGMELKKRLSKSATFKAFAL